MAGSYKHVTDDQGRLLCNRDVVGMLENGGDVFEAVEEMYGMIWALAGGNKLRVLAAEKCYKDGLRLSPGTGAELPHDD